MPQPPSSRRGETELVDVDPNRPAPAASPPPPPGMVITARDADAYFLWELRKYVLLQAMLAASVTYSPGLSPPGGVWPDNDSTGRSVHVAGDPVLQDTYASRYETFFYFNATAFVASIVTINLLLMQSLSRHRGWLRSLQAAMILDLLGLMGAYAAGSCTELAMSAYVIALVALVSSYVCTHVLLFAMCALKRRGAGADNVMPDDEEHGTVERSRKYLLIFATLVATVTYQAGLSTQSGFLGFFYFNTTAFVASLVVIMLLMSRTVTRHGFRSCALWVCTGAALIGLTGAFAVGSSRSVKTSIYVVALVVAVLSYIGLQVLVFFCRPVENWVHSVQDKLQRYLRLDQIEQQDPRVRAVYDPQETAEADQLLQKSRMYLLLLGILAASVTYQAGLNPPGGFIRQPKDDYDLDSCVDYVVGDPVLQIKYPTRYLVFFYCNTTAFVASWVILILLLSNIFSTQGIKYSALQVFMIMDLLGLIGAYAAGSCRQVSKSVYVALVIPVFLYVGIHVMVFMLEIFPNMGKIVRDKLEESVPRWLKRLFELPPEEDENIRWKLEKRRKLLLLLAILAASLTYQAGLSPPGSFWQEDGPSHHVIGNPVLNDNYPLRYMVFFYFNATAFVSSLAIITLLVNRKLSPRGIQSRALSVCVILDLVGLMGAFSAGSSRKVSTSIYVLILAFAVLVYIMLQVVLVVSVSVEGLLQRLLSFFDATEGEAGFILPHTAVNNGVPRDLCHEKSPKYLLLLASLAANVTYQAAMNPPGGLWDDSLAAFYVAGDPVLRSSHPYRYEAFFYCNATSFMASLVIMVLLLIKRVCRAKQAILALHTATMLNLFGLMGAYAAGSCRSVNTYAYIVMELVIGVSVFIAILVMVSVGVAKRLKGVMDMLVERVIWCFSIEDL